MFAPLRMVIAIIFAWWVILFQKPTAVILIPLFYFISPISFYLLMLRLFQLNVLLIPLVLWFLFISSPRWEIFWQANIIVMGVTILLGNLELFQMAKALQFLKLPPKLVYLFFFTIRYLEVLKQTFEEIQRAMRGRGFKLQTNLHTYQSIGNALGMLLIKSLLKAQRVEQAMRCRGFQGTFPVLYIEKPKVTDYLYAGGLLGTMFLLTILD